MKALMAENLCVGYDKKIVVNNVRIDSMKGQIICLLGPNGAGKTTILRTLAGLLEPVRGVIYINDQKISAKKKKDLARELSVVLTQKFSGELMTAFEVASMGRYPHTGFFGKLEKEDIKKIEQALQTVNAEGLSERIFEELSDGEKQKILVARALVQEPDVMILDEPTTHLDIKHRLELMEILKKLSREKNISIILSLHEVDIAIKSCDKVLLVKDNKVLAYGECEEVVDECVVRDLFNIKKANYNNLLGSIEISNSVIPSVFILGGGGFGIPLYRFFARQEVGAVTGILHRNDIDYEIARTMGLSIVQENPFESISDITYERARLMLDAVEILIDTGFPVGRGNIRNMDLVRYALKKGKFVISLRRLEDNREMFPDLFNRIHLSCTPRETLEKIRQNSLVTRIS